MEENKLGMGWYDFLRYITFGLFRYGYGVLALLCLIASFTKNGALLFTLFLYYGTLFLVCGIVHSHLKNYSDQIVGVFLGYMIFSVAINLISFSEDAYGAGSGFASSILYYFINRSYFKKRSHIFVNKCDFLGRKIEPEYVPATDDILPENFSVPHFTNNFCRMCGTKLEPGDKFCNRCGTKIITMQEE